MEYPYVEDYKKALSGSKVELAALNSNMSDLLACCSLVVTVSSTVYFEAKTIGKRVAILKVDNYFYMEPYVKKSNNSCIVENAGDILKALTMPETSEEDQYYKPFDKSVANDLLV